MSIEKLEEIINERKKEYDGKGLFYCFGVEDIFEQVLDILKSQSDAIVNIEKQLAEGDIDYENIKIGGTD